MLSLNDRLALGYKAMIFDLIEGGVGHDRVNEVVKGSIAAARTLAREAEDGLQAPRGVGPGCSEQRFAGFRIPGDSVVPERGGCV